MGKTWVIKNIDGAVKFEIEAESFKAAVEKVKNKLEGADLRNTNLGNADLRGANLGWADLTWTNLIWADLRGANLRGADLSGVDLSGVDLRNADLSGASLRYAYLSNTDLREANLRGADLSFANLSGVCWPLSDCSLNVKIDKHIFCQLLYHTLKAGQSVDDPEVKKLFEIPDVVHLANQFHLLDECGKSEVKNERNYWRKK